MNEKNDASILNPLPALGILAIIAAITYMVIRGILLSRADYAAMDGILAVLLLVAECFIMIHSIGYTINILRVHGKRISERSDFRALDPYQLPSVAILVAARHEPSEVLQRTFLTIQNIDYGNKKVYFLDDSLDLQYKKEAEKIARDHDLVLFQRTRPWHGAKAGIVNDCLETLSEKYIVIFDADQNPMPDFLKVIVPLMEADEKRAFIQTPQFYTNIDENRIARAAVLQQAVFYEYICEGKGVSDAMFCCGTNVIFRTSSLRDVGGMDESTVTEDFATSLKFHSKGYRSLYYSHVCAFGMGPEDLTGYFKQQFRWAAGTINVFKKLLRQLFRNPFSLSPGQWFEYFLSSTYYFVGCAFSVLMVCPVIFIFWKIPSFFANPEVYLLAFLPYMSLTMSIFYFALKRRHYSPRDLVLGQLLGAITFFVYTKAALAALLGIKIPFGVTPKSRGGVVPYRMLWPQMIVLMVNFVAVIWALNRFVYEHDGALPVNAFWAFYHFLVFSSIFYFNRGNK